MFGLGLTEIIVIVVIVIVVIKPEDLPGFFKSVGKSYSEVKKTCNDVKKMKDDFIELADADIKEVVTDHAKKVITEEATDTKKD